MFPPGRNGTRNIVKTRSKTQDLRVVFNFHINNGLVYAYSIKGLKTRLFPTVLFMSVKAALSEKLRVNILFNFIVRKC